MAETATQEFVHNLHALPHTVKDACFRLGKAPESEREETLNKAMGLLRALEIAEATPLAS